MKIAYIGLRGVPATYSGIELAVEELGSRIAARGHDVTVYCMEHWYKEKLATYKGMQLQYVKTYPSKNLEMILYAFSSTIRAIAKDFDIFHFHGIGPATMALMPWACRKKTIVTVHALDWRNEKWSLPARTYLRLGEYMAARFPEKTIVVSKYLKKYYQDNYGKFTDYIPNGVDIKSVEEDMSIFDKLGIKKNKYIIFVVRLTRAKNVHVLIEAFLKVNTDKKLCIVGGEKDITLDELRSYAQSDSRILFAGPIYGDDVVRLLQNCYLYVLPSVLEGLPVSVMEAMAYGSTVLVSDIAENLEVITDDGNCYGLTFHVGDVNDLQQALQQLVDDRALVDRFRVGASQFVKDRYNWDRIADETLSLYQEI